MRRHTPRNKKYANFHSIKLYYFHFSLVFFFLSFFFSHYIKHTHTHTHTHTPRLNKRKTHSLTSLISWWVLFFCRVFHNHRKHMSLPPPDRNLQPLPKTRIPYWLRLLFPIPTTPSDPVLHNHLINILFPNTTKKKVLGFPTLLRLKLEKAAVVMVTVAAMVWLMVQKKQPTTSTH